METIYEKNLKYMLNKLKVIAIINISIKPAYISLTKVLGGKTHGKGERVWFHVLILIFLTSHNKLLKILAIKINR